MFNFLRVIAIAVTLVLTLAGAQAGEQSALIQRTFDALRQSATALDQGNTSKAQALLTGIKSSAQALRTTAERYRQQAQAIAGRRQSEAVAVTTKISESFQAEQAADKDVLKLNARIADLNMQLKLADKHRTTLDQQAANFRREVVMRAGCKKHFLDGLFWNSECLRLGWADLTNDRWISLNNDIQGNNIQRRNIETERRNLNGELNGQQARLGEARKRKTQLEAQRKSLEQQVTTLRAAVVSLSDASVFWADTVTLIGSRITSIETLEQNVQILIGRADRKSMAPVFDRYDKEDVRSLEETLLDFARTLDDRSSILLQQQ